MRQTKYFSLKRSKKKKGGGSHNEIWSPERNFRMTDIQACWLVNKNITVIEIKISGGRHNFKSLVPGGLEKMSLRALVWEIFLL